MKVADQRFEYIDKLISMRKSMAQLAFPLVVVCSEKDDARYSQYLRHHYGTNARTYGMSCFDTKVHVHVLFADGWTARKDSLSAGKKIARLAELGVITLLNRSDGTIAMPDGWNLRSDNVRLAAELVKIQKILSAKVKE